MGTSEKRTFVTRYFQRFTFYKYKLYLEKKGTINSFIN